MKLLDKAASLVAEIRTETSAATIEDLLAWQKAILPKLTMARIRKIVDTKGASVDEHELTQLKFVLEEWSVKKKWWRI